MEKQAFNEKVSGIAKLLGYKATVSEELQKILERKVK